MPSNQNLINNLTATQSSNTTAIGIASEAIVPIQAEIDLITPTCKDIDEQILPIIIQIQNLQDDLIQAYEDANAVGCGTTVGVTTYYQDVVTNRSQNINSSNYTGTDPFGGQTSASISAANVGVGTLTVYSANGGTGIGSAYAGISSCYNNLLGCDLAESSTICAGWASTITSIENQITALRNQLPAPIADTNRLKAERRELEVQRYGDLFIIGRLEERNVAIGSVTTTTQEYSSND